MPAPSRLILQHENAVARLSHVCHQNGRRPGTINENQNQTNHLARFDVKKFWVEVGRGAKT